MWSTVDLREIRVFLVLADELHFGRAAERLTLTPSRVSQILRTLETRIGGQLFARTSRRVALTPLGNELLLRVEPAYEAMERAFAETREAATGVVGPLRLGSYLPVNYGPHFLEIVKTFEERYPANPVLLTDTGLVRDQLDWLRQDELDLLAMRLPLAQPELTIGPVLSREERVVAVAKDHPLATKESVELDDLAEYQIPIAPSLPPEMLDAFVPPRTPSGRPVQRIVLRSTGESMSRVATGRVVHITVRSFVEQYSYPGIVGIPIRDLPPSETALVWLTPRESNKIRAFAQAATDVMRGH